MFPVPISSVLMGFHWVEICANITAMLRLQESSRLLDGQRGYLKVKGLQKMLRQRQQYMVSQVSLLYPVKISVGKALEQELESFPSSTKSGS